MNTKIFTTESQLCPRITHSSIRFLAPTEDNYQYVVAPIAAPLTGNKKSLPTILPVLALAPVTALELTLLKVALFHVPPMFQLFPLCV